MTEEFKFFTSDQMTNEFYHSDTEWTKDYVSGSDLGEIFATCPASWKFGEKKDSKALVFGTQSHTNYESRELFNSNYRRAPHVDDFKDAITSQAALATKLKSFGLTGTSGKQYPELVKMMVDCGEELNVMWLIDMIAESQARKDGVELVKAEDYDACIKMRQVLEQIPAYADRMNSPTAQHEMSIFGVISGVKVKVRLDYVDVVSDPEFIRENGIDPDVHPEVILIDDYKTTASANPAEFGRLAANLGYLLKMALQRDLFKKVFNETRPIIVRLLAQEKKPPYLPLAYRLIDKHIGYGRQDYMSVIHTYAACVESNVWPSYANGQTQVDLELPEWFEKRYNKQ